jgi:cystathionine gamma-lyase
LEFTFVDTTKPADVEKAFRPDTKLLWLESPSNPLLRVSDLKALCSLARKRGVAVAVDNTFASPAVQNPLDFGADLVVHSTTKYLGGHSDLVGGCVVTNDPQWHEKLKFLQNSVGAVPGPMDCFLVLRGTKTLSVRMERHCESALLIARHLEKHPDVEKVHYPGLESHAGHQIAKSQMKGFGGMISFELEGGLERAKKMLAQTKIFSLAESLGGVESLIGHPATMTHASIPREERLKAGLADSLIRLSVGIENVEDLIADLDQAISASSAR